MVIVQHHTCTTYQVPGTASVGTSTVVYFSVLRVPHTIVHRKSVQVFSACHEQSLAFLKVF